MSREPNKELFFNVVGTGYVAERHAEEKHRHLLQSDTNAVGGAMAWLAFYALAIVVVVTANLQKAASIVVASVN